MLGATEGTAFSRARVQQQIKSKVFEWSVKRKTRQSRFGFKMESFDYSNFQNLGVSSVRS